jgi:hypothetical protein
MTIPMSRRLTHWVGPLVVLAIVFGCESKPRTVTVTGSVMKGGQPLPVSKTGYVQIMLLPDVGADEQYTTRVGRCENDGTFSIPEVPPGKYKIGIEQFDPNPQIDKLNGAFRAGDSKVVLNIEGKAPINIDLGKANLGQ